MNIIPNLNIRVMRSSPEPTLSSLRGPTLEQDNKALISPAQKKTAIRIINYWDSFRNVETLRKEIFDNFSTIGNFRNTFDVEKNFKDRKEVKLRFVTMLKKECDLEQGEHQDLNATISAFEGKIQQQETPATPTQIPDPEPYSITKEALDSNEALNIELEDDDIYKSNQGSGFNFLTSAQKIVFGRFKEEGQEVSNAKQINNAHSQAILSCGAILKHDGGKLDKIYRKLDPYNKALFEDKICDLVYKTLTEEKFKLTLKPEENGTSYLENNKNTIEEIIKIRNTYHLAENRSSDAEEDLKPQALNYFVKSQDKNLPKGRKTSIQIAGYSLAAIFFVAAVFFAIAAGLGGVGALPAIGAIAPAIIFAGASYKAFVKTNKILQDRKKKFTEKLKNPKPIDIIEQEITRAIPVRNRERIINKYIAGPAYDLLTTNTSKRAFQEGLNNPEAIKQHIANRDNERQRRHSFFQALATAW